MKKRTWALAALALAACTTPPPPAQTEACLPDDGLDDRECIQARVDAACAAGGGEVRLGPGRWVVSPDPGLGLAHGGGLRLWCSRVSLVGSGPSTVLSHEGDQAGRGGHLVRVASDPTTHLPVEDVAVSDMTLEVTGRLLNTQEQSHVLTATGVNGPVRGLRLRRLVVRNELRATDRSGDCLRLVGATGGAVEDTAVEDVRVPECDRSGLAVQGGVRGVALRGSMFGQTMKVALDLEPTGGGEVSDVVVTGNRFARTASLNGQGDVPTRRVVFSQNVMQGVGARVSVLYSRDVVVSGNVVVSTAEDAEATVSVRASEDVVVSGNRLVRQAGVAGPVLRAVGNSGRFPRRVTFQGNQLAQWTDSDVVWTESAEDLLVSGNVVQYLGPPGRWAGLAARATGAHVLRPRVEGNTFLGSSAWAVRLVASPQSVVDARVADNVVSGPPVALRCESPGGFSGTSVHRGTYPAGVTPASNCPALSP